MIKDECITSHKWTRYAKFFLQISGISVKNNSNKIDRFLKGSFGRTISKFQIESNTISKDERNMDEY